MKEPVTLVQASGEPERVILAGVFSGVVSSFDEERKKSELTGLARACGMEPAAVVFQHLAAPDPTRYMGSGKLSEIRSLAGETGAELVVFDRTLTPSQLRNIQNELDLPVLDRTGLILDIFERRAGTREAKLQVEVAKLQYMLPRLTGLRPALTRQGGTTGSRSSRGAGEKKLELDRRRIARRITELKKELKEVSEERSLRRRRRGASGLPVAALVGYTNAGKSTILNAVSALCRGPAEKQVFEADMLFATLDTSVRRIETDSGFTFLLTDTVGFIEDLPETLFKAFRSTLEEVKEADLLLNVIDLSDPHSREQSDVTLAVLEEIEAGGIPVLTVCNKADRAEEAPAYPRAYPGRVTICAKEPESVRLLLSAIEAELTRSSVEAWFFLPFSAGAEASMLMENGMVLEKAFTEEGVRLHVRCTPALAEKFRAYRQNGAGSGLRPPDPGDLR